MEIEAAAVSFAASDIETYNFVKTFATPPFVTVGVVDTGPDDMGVTAKITAVSTVSVTIEASAPFTGDVHIHATLGS